MDDEDCFAHFDQTEPDEIVIETPSSSTQLLENLLKLKNNETSQSLVEHTFYIQCKILENSGSVSIHVCELGRHDIRVYGYYCAEAKDLETNPSLNLCMKSIQLKGYWDEQTNMFVVTPQEFREKNIMFEGTMPSVVPSEVHKFTQTDNENSSTQVVDSSNLKCLDTAPVHLDVAAVTALMSAVERNCPELLLSGSIANNSQFPLPSQLQSPMKSTGSVPLESPTTMVFGYRPPLCEPLTSEMTRAPLVVPSMNASIIQSDMAFPSSSQSQRMVSLHQHNRSPTPPFYWGPVSLPQATNQISQPQPPFHQARRSLHFPSTAQTSRQALPLASSAANFASAALPANPLHQASSPMNYASSMAANVSKHQISRVSVEVVRQPPGTLHGHKPSVNSNLSGYAKMFESVKKPQSEQKNSTKQVVESRVAAVVAQNPVESPLHNAVDDNYTVVNGIPCFYIVGSNGTRQLMVSREYFIRPTSRYEGFDSNWVFLRDSENSASYYRAEIKVDPEKIKIPGHKNYEIVDLGDGCVYYRVNPAVIMKKVCNVKQDVFPFFYKNSTQYKSLKDEEKEKYVACLEGPKPPFENAKYSNFYYLKEIHDNDLSSLQLGYPVISSYYSSPSGSCFVNTFSVDYHKKVVQIMSNLERLFAKELNKEFAEAQKQLPTIPKKVREDEDSVKFAKKHGKGKKQSRKKSGSNGCDNVSWSDLDGELDVEEVPKKRSREPVESSMGFYDLCARIDRGEKVVPDKKNSSEPSSKRRKSER